MLQLRWLRMEAIDDLQEEEYDLIQDFTTRYQEGKSPSFSEKEIEALNIIYKRVRGDFLIKKKMLN